MKKIILVYVFALLFALAGFAQNSFAAADNTIILPAVQKTGGKPIMDALALRKRRKNYDKQTSFSSTIEQSFMGCMGHQPLRWQTHYTYGDE
ncbi:MAG: hypothetical protein LBN20_03575 [Endomicrobium sp.]|nr:hypothetical protein [Endomicrobium sp.]